MFHKVTNYTYKNYFVDYVSVYIHNHMYTHTHMFEYTIMMRKRKTFYDYNYTRIR